jgi:hypothetical protein
LNGTRSIVGYFAVVCLGWIAPCYAAEPLAGLLACRTLSDAAARLACFDRETAALEAKVAAPAAAAAPRPVPRLDPTGQFGLPEHTVAKQEVAAGTRAVDAPKIEAHILQLSKTANGRAIFTLDNAQVWRQLVADVDVLAIPGDAVIISRGALGSYWLQTKSKRGCKVTRLR